MGIPAPTFSWPPPTDLDAFWGWLNEVVDWLYNVFFPAINAALDAWHSFLNSITDIYNVIDDILESLNDLVNLIEEQINRVIDWVDENQECISFGISMVAFVVSTFILPTPMVYTAFAVGAGAGLVNVGLNAAQGDKEGMARSGGFVYGQGQLFAYERASRALSG